MQRQRAIAMIQHIVDEKTQLVEAHDSGEAKLPGTDYWNHKAAIEMFKPLLKMFKSNMTDDVSSNI